MAIEEGFGDLGADLIHSVEEVLRDECPLDVVRAAGADPTRWRALWDTATELGWQALGVPAAAGGLGLGLAAEAALLERAGGALFPAPLLSTALATAMLRGLLHGECDRKAVIAALEQIADGAAASIAVADADGARVVGDGETLTGTKVDVTDVSRAQVLVVTAIGIEGGGTVATLVDPARAAVEVRPNVDPTRPLGEVALDVAPAVPLGEGTGYGLRAAAVLASAELVGVAARALDLAVAHARDRVQFGRPIGAFQGVKHRLADVYVAVERARSLVQEAAAGLDGAGPAAAAANPVPVAMAKAAASEAALFATRGAIQVTGALGISAEHDLVHLLRRAHQGAHLFGDARSHYTAVGRAVLEQASGRGTVGDGEVR